MYQPIPVDYEDISGIKGGENVKDLVQIQPLPCVFKALFIKGIPGFFWCVILLSDHTTFSVFFDFEGNAYSPQILKQNQADNPFTEVAEGTIETVGDYTSPWNIYDFLDSAGGLPAGINPYRRTSWFYIKARSPLFAGGRAALL